MHDQPEPADVVEMDSGRRWRRPGWLPALGPGLLALAALVIGRSAGSSKSAASGAPAGRWRARLPLARSSCWRGRTPG